MSAYRHILLATDFGDNCDDVANRALDLAQHHQATLELLHVVDYVPMADSAYGPAVPFDVELSEQLMASARKRLAALAARLGVAENACHVEIGSPKIEIIRIADELKADLIVIGSHGRHGLQLLLGSTASGVLHRAPCDVLAVRVHTA